jgi:prepilin-type N-terminal cleavage/methylation domain-containing protein
MKNNEKAFTLMELLVAIFVLSVGIIAVLQAFPLGAKIQKSAQMTTIALNLAQGRMEETLSNSYEELIIGTTTEDYGFSESQPDFKRVTVINYFNPDNPGIVPGSDLGIKKIDITVYWKSSLGIGEKDVKISTLSSQK